MILTACELHARCFTLEDQVLETLLREALDGVVTKVSSHKGLQQSFTRMCDYPCNQLGNELASWLIGQAGIPTGIDCCAQQTGMHEMVAEALLIAIYSTRVTS
jgi:hypothetical protein